MCTENNSRRTFPQLKQCSALHWGIKGNFCFLYIFCVLHKCCINKEVVWTLSPSSWHRAPKTLGISQMIRMSLPFLSPWITFEFMLIRWVMVSPIIASQQRLSNLMSQPDLREEAGGWVKACSQWLKQPCLRKETPIKTLEPRLGGAPGWWTHQCCLGGWNAVISWGKSTEAIHSKLPLHVCFWVI